MPQTSADALGASNVFLPTKSPVTKHNIHLHTDLDCDQRQTQSGMAEDQSEDQPIEEIEPNKEIETHEAHTKRVLLEKFGVTGKPDQIRAIKELVFEHRDVVLIAKTGFGKSVVYQAPSFMYSEPKITIVIMPLKALQHDQEVKLGRIPGCKPFVLDGDANTARNRRAIRECHYTHILTSPEIATSKPFNEDVLRCYKFQSKLCLLAIDELHLVEDWSTFRPVYMELYVLRSRLSASLPFLGLSATLNDRVLQRIKDSCGFRSTKLSVIKTPLDRPEIYLELRPLSGTMKDLVDLHHLLPIQAIRAVDVPKTIIFMETINTIRATYSLMQQWMRSLGYPKSSRDWIEMYFSEMSDPDKDRIAERFLRRSEECDGPRILIATDAYGLGVDNPDVERVVQVKVPKKLSSAIQRAGRAMRCGEKQAWYLLLYENDMDTRQEDPQSNPAMPMEDSQDTQDMPVETSAKATQESIVCPDMKAIVLASQERKCIRLAVLERLNAVDLIGTFAKPVPCCSSCNPEAGARPIVYEKITQEEWCNSLKQPWFDQHLGRWLSNEVDRIKEDVVERYQGHKNLVVPTKTYAKVIRSGDIIQDAQTLRRLGGEGWAMSKTRSKEIMDILHRGQAYGPTSDEVRSAALNQKLKSFEDKRQARLSAESASVLRIEAEKEWQTKRTNRGKNGLVEPKKANKRKREVQAPANASALNQVRPTPALKTSAPLSSNDNKENDLPVLPPAQDETRQRELAATKVVNKPSAVKKVKKAKVVDLSNLEAGRANQVLRPSSTRQNRRVPERYLA